MAGSMLTIEMTYYKAEHLPEDETAAPRILNYDSLLKRRVNIRDSMHKTKRRTAFVAGWTE